MELVPSFQHLTAEAPHSPFGPLVLVLRATVALGEATHPLHTFMLTGAPLGQSPRPRLQRAQHRADPPQLSSLSQCADSELKNDQNGGDRNGGV